MRSLSCSALALALVTVPAASAQASEAGPRRIAVTGAPVYSRLNLDSGVVTTLPGPAGLSGPSGSAVGGTAAGLGGGGQVLCLDNTQDEDPDSLFGSPIFDALLSDAGDEFLDWGVKWCSGSGLVERISIGYASQALPAVGGALEVRVYAGTQGFGNAGSEVAVLSLTGLESDGLQIPLIPHLMTIDLGSQAFFLSDGPVGWSYRIVDGLTGPLSVDVGPQVSTQNYMDWYTPGPASTGTFNSTFSLGAGGVSMDPFENTVYFQMFQSDGGAPADLQKILSAANDDILDADGGPVPNTTWTLSFDLASTPGVTSTVVVLSGEQLLPALSTSIGVLLVDLFDSTIATSVSAGAQHAFNVPADPSLLGQIVYAQGATVTPAGEHLTNALAGTFGF